MILKLLGVIDLIIAVLLFIYPSFKIVWFIMVGFGLYLIVKAFLFKDIASIIDGVVGFYIFLMVFGVKTILPYIFAIYLLQKFVVSLIPSR